MARFTGRGTEGEEVKHRLHTCDACKTEAAASFVEPRKYDGMDLILCKDPVPCRRRAENKGIYKAL